MIFDLNKKHCYFFNEISKIPRSSSNEKAVSDYVVSIAKRNNLKYIQDDKYNVVVYKEGTNNSNEPLIMQAHLDMVPEKIKGSNHDFLKDPLQLYVEDGFLKAKDTTLGSDDGHGVSIMLSIMDDNTLVHPPLELVFTAEEEIGLFGALNLKAEYFNAKRMISFDGGAEGKTLMSTAGGATVELFKELKFEENSSNTFTLSVSGLVGGHSGLCIALERGNSNKIAFRILKELQLNNIKIKLVDIQGGLKMNAIPIDTTVTFISDENSDLIFNCINTLANKLKTEFEHSDGNLVIECSQVEKANKNIIEEISNDIINGLYLTKDGLISRSMAIEGMIVTSLNFGILTTEEEKLCCTFSLRSSLESGINELVNHLTTIGSIFNFEIKVSAKYPGWNYNPVSKMRDSLKATLKEVLNKDLITVAVHGGNEIGIFCNMIPEMDAITVMPLHYDVHTPKERLDLSSFDREYDLTLELIKKL